MDLQLLLVVRIFESINNNLRYLVYGRFKLNFFSKPIEEMSIVIVDSLMVYTI